MVFLAEKEWQSAWRLPLRDGTKHHSSSKAFGFAAAGHSGGVGVITARMSSSGGTAATVAARWQRRGERRPSRARTCG